MYWPWTPLSRRSALAPGTALRDHNSTYVWACQALRRKRHSGAVKAAQRQGEALTALLQWDTAGMAAAKPQGGPRHLWRGGPQPAGTALRFPGAPSGGGGDGRGAGEKLPRSRAPKAANSAKGTQPPSLGAPRHKNGLPGRPLWLAWQGVKRPKGGAAASLSSAGRVAMPGGRGGTGQSGKRD